MQLIADDTDSSRDFARQFKSLGAAHDVCVGAEHYVSSASGINNIANRITSNAQAKVRDGKGCG